MTKKAKETPPAVPLLNFFMLISAPRNSGKSYFTNQLILQPEYLRKVFVYKEKCKKKNCDHSAERKEAGKCKHGKDNWESIFIFSPSADVDNTYDEIKTPYKFTDGYKEIVTGLMDTQKALIQEHGKEKVRPILIVLDDMLDSNAYLHNSPIYKLSIRGRHLKINVIIISQSFKGINRTIRLNSDWCVFFSPSSESEFDRLAEEFCGKKDRQAFIDKLKELYASEKYVPFIFDVQKRYGTAYRWGLNRNFHTLELLYGPGKSKGKDMEEANTTSS